MANMARRGAALGAGVAVTLSVRGGGSNGNVVENEVPPGGAYRGISRGEIDEAARTIFAGSSSGGASSSSSSSSSASEIVGRAGHELVSQTTRGCSSDLLRFGHQLARDPAVQRAILSQAACFPELQLGLGERAREEAIEAQLAELKRSLAEVRSDLEDQQDLNRDLVLFQDRLMTKNDALLNEVRELRAVAAFGGRAPTAAYAATAAAQGAAEMDVASALLAEAEIPEISTDDELEEGSALGWQRPSLEAIRARAAARRKRFGRGGNGDDGTGEWLVAAGVGVAAAIVLFAVFKRKITAAVSQAASTKAIAKLVSAATSAMWKLVR